MDIFEDYIVVIILGICLCVGYIIKNVVPGTAINKFIPLIMGLLGVTLNCWINLTVSPEIILGGLISGLSSTGMYEAFHQSISKG